MARPGPEGQPERPHNPSAEARGKLNAFVLGEIDKSAREQFKAKRIANRFRQPTTEELYQAGGAMRFLYTDITSTLTGREVKSVDQIAEALENTLQNPHQRQQLADTLSSMKKLPATTMPSVAMATRLVHTALEAGLDGSPANKTTGEQEAAPDQQAPPTFRERARAYNKAIGRNKLFLKGTVGFNTTLVPAHIELLSQGRLWTAAGLGAVEATATVPAVKNYIKRAVRLDREGIKLGTQPGKKVPAIQILHEESIETVATLLPETIDRLIHKVPNKSTDTPNPNNQPRPAEPKPSPPQLTVDTPSRAAAVNGTARDEHSRKNGSVSNNEGVKLPAEVSMLLPKGVQPEIARLGDKVLFIARRGDGQPDDVVIVRSEDTPVLLRDVQISLEDQAYIIRRPNPDGTEATYHVKFTGDTDIPFPTAPEATNHTPKAPDTKGAETTAKEKAVEDAWRKVLEAGEKKYDNIIREHPDGTITEETITKHTVTIGDKVVESRFELGTVKIKGTRGELPPYTNVKPKLNAKLGVLEFIERTTKRVLGGITIDGRTYDGPIPPGGAAPAPEAKPIQASAEPDALTPTPGVVAVPEDPAAVELRNLRAQLTFEQQKNLHIDRIGGSTAPVAESPDRDIERAPERASRFYVKTRKLLTGDEIGPSQYPHPTWGQDVAANFQALVGRVKRTYRVNKGTEPGKELAGDREWLTRKEMDELIVDPNPGARSRAGRATLGRFEGQVIATPRHMGFIVVERSGKGKTSFFLAPAIADWQGLAVVEAPIDLMKATFNARHQKGSGNEILTLSPLLDEARRQYGGYAGTWPIINEFATFDGAIRISDDLTRDGKRGQSKSGSDTHDTFWRPLGKTLIADAGNATAINGEDLPEFLSRLRLLNRGLAYSENGQVAPPEVRTQIEGIFERSAGQLVQAQQSIAGRLMEAYQIKDDEERARRIHNLELEFSFIEHAQYGLGEASEEFAAFGALHPKTASTVASTARTILDAFRGPEIVRTLSHSANEINPRDLSTRTIYVNVNDTDAARLGKIQRAFHSTATGALKDRHAATMTAHDPGVGYFVDEGGISQLDALGEDVVSMRKMGGSTFIAGQTGGLLIKTLGKEGMEAVLANNEVILGPGADPEVVRIISAQAGTAEVRKPAVYYPTARTTPLRVGPEARKQNRQNRNEAAKLVPTQVPRVDQNDVRRLKGTRVILIHDADKPVAIDGQPYHENKQAQRIPEAPKIPAPPSPRFAVLLSAIEQKIAFEQNGGGDQAIEAAEPGPTAIEASQQPDANYGLPKREMGAPGQAGPVVEPPTASE